MHPNPSVCILAWTILTLLVGGKTHFRQRSGAGGVLNTFAVSLYLQAVGIRETKAFQCLKPPKQTALVSGPKLYPPDMENKITALAWYWQAVNALIPADVAITRTYFWHDDLHDDPDFIGPPNPEKVSGIVDVDFIL